MKIYELVKKLNTKIQVKYSDVIAVKKYYLSMYRAYMVAMYDKGYISDPTVFNRKEIFLNIVDMRIKYLTGVTGKIELSEDNIGFALAKYKNDKDISDFLSLLLKVVKYRSYCVNIDKFYDDCELFNGSKKKISLNIVQAASKIYYRSGYELDESTLKCFYGLLEDFEFVSLNEVVYEAALEVLGIDEKSESSLFVSGLTREEEIKFSNIILNGLVNLDGKYADRLVDWLKNNKWSNDNKFSSQNEGLYNWFMFIKSNDTIEEQSKLLNRLVDEGKSIVGIKSEGFYIIDENKSTLEVPVGVFSVMSDEEDVVLPEINRLEGYTGEVYLVSSLARNEVSYVGCPIELFIKDNKKALFVDKEQTDVADAISWFEHIDASITFDENYRVSNKFTEGSLESKLLAILENAERGLLVNVMSKVDYLEITDSIKKTVINSLN